MLLQVIEALLLAAALCADCFAVSACSSVSIRSRRWGDILSVALAFAVIQTALFVIGVLLGDLVSGLLMGVAHFIGFGLLLYVGGSMLYDASRKEQKEGLELSGFKNILIGGTATSIDALSVGASMAIEGIGMNVAILDSVSIFAVTFISVVLGIFGGSLAGQKFGRPALIFGGIVLILIGINILFGIV